MNIYDEIAKVAYEIWVKKGMPDGNDLENWFEAEQIVYASLRGNYDSSTEENEYSVTTVIPVSQTDVEPKKAEDPEVKDKPKKKTTKTSKTTSTASTKAKSKKTTTTKKKS